MNNTTAIFSGPANAQPQLLMGITLIFTDVLILILNFFAVFIIYRFKQKYIPDVLIFSLACADLAKGVFPVPMSIGVYMGWWRLTKGSFGCKMFAWTGFTTNSGAMLVLTLMSCDRYIAICWPFEYKSRISVRKVCYIVTGICVFAGIHSLLPMIGIGKVSSYQKDTFCHFDFDASDRASTAYSIYIVLLGFSMLLLVVFCYSRSMCKVRGLIQRSQRRMSVTPQSMSQYKQEAATNRMNYMFARMMIVLMLSFLISWLLFLVVVFSHVTKWFSISNHMHFWSMRLAVFNSVFNPLIGAAMCKPYRRGYKYILHRICCCCSAHTPLNPWSRRRQGSTSIPSKDRSDTISKGVEEQPSTEDKCNVTFGSSAHDSGIVPDSGDVPEKTAGYKASWHLNQGFDLHQISSEQHENSKKPGGQSKKISFKDELDLLNRHSEATKASSPSNAKVSDTEVSGATKNIEQRDRKVGNTGCNVELGLVEERKLKTETNVLTDGQKARPAPTQKSGEEGRTKKLSATSTETGATEHMSFHDPKDTDCSIGKVLSRSPSTPTFVHITHFPVDRNSPVEIVASVQTRAKSFHDFGKSNVGQRTRPSYGPNSADSCRCSRTSKFNGDHEQRGLRQPSATNGAEHIDQHTTRDSFQSTLEMPCTVLADANVEGFEGSLKVLDKSPVIRQEMSYLHRRRSNSQPEVRDRREHSDGGHIAHAPPSCTPLMRRRSPEQTLQRMPVEIHRRLNRPSRNKCRREVIC